MKQIASEAKANGRKVVAGAWRIRHPACWTQAHLDIGKRHGDVLIVTLTTDKFVNRGPTGGLCEKLRAEMVAGLESVRLRG